MVCTTVEEKTRKLKQILTDRSADFDDFISPLDPGLRFGKLYADQAKVFTSKKMPLMLTWDKGALLFKVKLVFLEKRKLKGIYSLKGNFPLVTDFLTFGL